MFAPTKNLKLVSALPPGECRMRLTARLARRAGPFSARYWRRSGEAEVSGFAETWRFKVARVAATRLPLPLAALGELTPAGQGSLVQIRFTVIRGPLVFAIVGTFLFGFVLPLALVVESLLAVPLEHWLPVLLLGLPWFALACCAIVGLFALWSISRTRRYAGRESTAITDFLRDALQAEERSWAASA